MCLAIPMEIIQLQGPRAQVLAQGLKQEINIELVPKAKVGDFVLVHAGFAIEKIHKEWALESLRLWEEMGEL